jgi:hypothetical protein
VTVYYDHDNEPSVSTKTGLFLTTCATVSFSVTTLLHDFEGLRLVSRFEFFLMTLVSRFSLVYFILAYWT